MADETTQVEVSAEEQKEAKKNIRMSQVRKTRKNLAYLQSKKDKGEKIVQTCPVALGPAFAMAAELADVDIIRINSMLSASYDMEEEERAAVPTILAYRQLAKNIHINYYPPTSSYASKEKAVAFCSNLIQSGADTVLPMGVTNETLRYMTDNYVPVYGHVGSISGWQTVATGYKKLGKTAEEAYKVFKMAYEYQENGMGCLTIELVPGEVSAAVAKKLRIPVIGIASGCTGGDSDVDGYEMVDMDTFGMMPGAASHVKKYAELMPFMIGAYAQWVNDVRTNVYPAENNGWHMDPEELEKFNTLIEDI